MSEISLSAGPRLDPASSPAQIEARSFAIIEAEIPEPRPFAGPAWEVARRCIHCLGDTAILADLRLDPGAIAAGLEALGRGCEIFTDTRMAASGLPRRRLEPLGVKVTAMPEFPGLASQAESQGITQARAAVLAHAKCFAGNILLIGNAPTALLTLLEELEAGRISAPALTIAMPVGFVNAAESKALLAQSPWPHLTLLGRKGGSALAAAALNALAEIALRRRRSAR